MPPAFEAEAARTLQARSIPSQARTRTSSQARPARSVNQPGPTPSAGPAGETRLRVGPAGGGCCRMLIPACGAAVTAGFRTTGTSRARALRSDPTPATGLEAPHTPCCKAAAPSAMHHSTLIFGLKIGCCRGLCFSSARRFNGGDSFFAQPAPQGRSSRFSSHSKATGHPHPIRGGGLVYSLRWCWDQ